VEHRARRGARQQSKADQKSRIRAIGYLEYWNRVGGGVAAVAAPNRELVQPATLSPDVPESPSLGSPGLLVKTHSAPQGIASKPRPTSDRLWSRAMIHRIRGRAQVSLTIDRRSAWAAQLGYRPWPRAVRRPAGISRRTCASTRVAISEPEDVVLDSLAGKESVGRVAHGLGPHGWLVEALVRRSTIFTCHSSVTDVSSPVTDHSQSPTPSESSGRGRLVHRRCAN
jgi:hypothetical protein